MRVAHVIYRFHPVLGGAEVYLEALRGALAGLAREQTVYQAALGPEEAGIVQVRVPRRTGLKLLDFNLALAARRAELLAHDVVIVHNPEHLTRGLGGARSILVSHGATWTHERGALRRLLRRNAMRDGFRRAGAVVANDSFVLRAMGIAVAPGARFREEVAPGVWFVPNAVDPAVFRPPPAGAPRGALPPGAATGPVVLVPRNLTRSRGIDLAIAAFSAARALPDDARLVIAGDAIPDLPASVRYRAQLQSLLQASGLAGRVSFLGGIAPGAMPELYRAAALTLVPTRYSEGTSLSALESMATAVATITTDVEGLRDLPGPHVPPTVEALAAGLERVWPGRDELGRAQRAAVERDFTLAAWAGTWRGIVRAVAERATTAARGRR
jgi:glycosyltransferase involved in cell wall biosynthesis